MNYYGETPTLNKRIISGLRIAASDISLGLNTHLNYLHAKKRLPNLRHPETLDEKLCWLKLHYYAKSDLAKTCADKYLVRSYLSSLGYENLLTELIDVYSDVSQIPWNRLPDRFAIKWSFGSGYNIICDNIANFDVELAIMRLKYWGTIPYWKLYSESQYKDVKPHLLIEEYLQGDNGQAPIDYKFYCFNGTANSVMLCVGRETGTPRFYFFDKEWNLLRINHWGQIADEDFSLPKPAVIDEMFELADKLSTPFPFVRMDFYEIDGEIRFGEFTFTPSAGFDPNRLPETDSYFGSLLNIEGMVG